MKHRARKNSSTSKMVGVFGKRDDTLDSSFTAGSTTNCTSGPDIRQHFFCYTNTTFNVVPALLSCTLSMWRDMTLRIVCHTFFIINSQRTLFYAIPKADADNVLELQASAMLWRYQGSHGSLSMMLTKSSTRTPT